jgi:hypothetical protein
MRGLAEETHTGVLTINGLELNGSWIRFRDLNPLLNAINEINNVTIARANGSRPKRYRRIQKELTLPFDLVGDILWNGTPQTNVYWGVQQNLMKLEAEIVVPAEAADDFVYPAVWVLADGSTELQGGVQVRQIEQGNRVKDLTYCTMDIVIPDGRLV